MTLTVSCLAAVGLGYFLGELSRPEVPGDSSLASDEAPVLLEEKRNAGASQSQPGKSFHESLQDLEDLRHQLRQPVGRFYSSTAGKQLLEVEAIFALADEAEMINYFAGVDFGREDPSFLSLAYRRLGELNLEAAILIWQEQYVQDQEGLGISGLVEAMTDSDPAGVESWIAGLPEERLRDKALCTFLNRIFESDPDKVRERFTEVDEMFPSIALATRLSWTLESHELRGMSDRILGMSQGKWEYQNQLRSVLQTWVEKDSGAMIAWLTSVPKGRIKEHVISQVTQSIIKENPSGFLQSLSPDFASNEGLANMAGQAWLGWLAEEGETEAALEWFAANDESLQASVENRWSSMDWTDEESLRVLKSLSALPDGTFRDQIATSALEKIVQREPKIALQFADEFMSVGQRKQSLVSRALSRLSQSGKTDEALEYALALREPSEKQDAVRSVLWELTTTDPFAALGHARQLQGAVRKEALSTIAYRWTEQDPDGAVAFLKQGSDRTISEDFSGSVFFAVGHKSGSAEKLNDALSVPKGALRDRAVHALFEGWARTNAETASAELMEIDPGPVRDQAIAGFVESVGFTDRKAAVAWALQIGDEEKRRSATIPEARRWIAAEREAAVQWIESQEGINDEFRQTLLDLAK